ncbi:MAG: cobalamin biosynthesis protein CbiX [Rhodobacteraceae bacterium]|nr:cobalamin biosynthesis protein CbiX [Paracoccaceae bacterium]
MAQPSALLVAHGYPSQPGPTEAAMQRLAGAVGAYLPGWQLRGATLAAPGALEQALDGLDAPLIYPFFMAEGWFTGRELPRRLAAAGKPDLPRLRPFGTDPGLVALIAETVAGTWPAEHPKLLLAAHGSKVSRTSRNTTLAMADALRAHGLAAQIECAFVEEAPFIADVARNLEGGTCLPFFALRAGHVTDDIPEALDEANFQGPCLAPIGEHEGVARLIARALQAH